MQYEDSDSGHVNYETHKAQIITTMLAAYAHTECPVMLDLTDGVTHKLMQIRDDDLYIWERLSPQQAYYKQAEVLKPLAGLLSEKRLLFNLEDIPEELRGPVKKARLALHPAV